MNLKISKTIIILSIISIIGCREKTPVQSEEQNYLYTIPQKRNDGWDTASLDDVGLSKSRISEMMEFFTNLAYHNVHGIIIIKDNKLVLEEYFKGFKYDNENVPSAKDEIQFGPDTLHYLSDVSKILIPAAFGAVINDGFIFDFDNDVKDYFPEYSALLAGDKGSIELENLMSMTSGFDWNESLFNYDNVNSDFQLLLQSEDPIKYILERDLSSFPGSRFRYNSGNSILLSEILLKITGSTVDQYAESNLFTPLEIKKVKWDYVQSSMVNSSAGLYMTPRDLAKLGQLFAGDGSWNGRTIISQEWKNYTNSPLIDLNYYFFANGYGSHVWIYNFEINQNTYRSLFWAGWGEQYLFLFPDQELVFVVLGGYYYDLIDFSIHSIVEKYLLDAISN